MQKFRNGPSHPAFFRVFAGLLVILAGAVPALADSQGLLPSLESEPVPAASTMTPITELIGQPESEDIATNIAPAKTEPTRAASPRESQQPPAQVTSKTAANKEINQSKAASTKAISSQADKATFQPDHKQKASVKTATAKAGSPSTALKGKTETKATTSKKPPGKQVTVGKIQPADLTPLLDQNEARQVSQTAGLKPLAADGHTLTPQEPALDDQALTPLHPVMGVEPLTPLHPGESSTALTPLQPAETTSELTPLQPQATQPTLDLSPASATGATEDLQSNGTATTQPAHRKPLAAKASVQATPQKPKVEPTETPKIRTRPEAQTADNTPATAEKPAKPQKKPSKLNIDVGQAIQNAKQTLTNGERTIKPVSYTALPGIAVFAVVKHGNERAFGDLPLLFAREYAQQLGAKLPETKIYNPIYTVDELRMQGLGHIYDQIMGYYIKTGAPEPAAMDYLLKQIGTNRPTISRVVFIEADVDLHHPDASTSFLDRTKQLLTDDQPKQMKYFVVSHVQIFDAEKPGYPIVWAGSWQRSVKADQFFNVTPSVYADSDSQHSFAQVSRQMSQELIFVTPKKAYMTPNFDTGVEGKLVSGKQPAFPGLSNSQANPSGLSHENKQAIERILQRQNEVGPK